MLYKLWGLFRRPANMIYMPKALAPNSRTGIASELQALQPSIYYPKVHWGFGKGSRQMAKGTVKWFNPTKGYGFIQPTDGGKDVFVHISAVERAGLSTLNEGQHVEYELVNNRGKSSAENLKVK